MAAAAFHVSNVCVGSRPGSHGAARIRVGRESSSDLDSGETDTKTHSIHRATASLELPAKDFIVKRKTPREGRAGLRRQARGRLRRREDHRHYHPSSGFVPVAVMLRGGRVNRINSRTLALARTKAAPTYTAAPQTICAASDSAAGMLRSPRNIRSTVTAKNIGIHATRGRRTCESTRAPAGACSARSGPQ